ncbi:MAG: DUF5107 domain-containing protein [Spirochaetaceae bacterium]
MSISYEILYMKGSTLGRENPLPKFRSLEREMPLEHDETFLEKDKKLFGSETGFRVLPYSLQDSYTRDKKHIELQTVVLENEFLRAQFLTDFGARLISLIDKKTGKELLFKNTVFQTANLAVRDAWFAGGIEWNIGQFGHTPLTCVPYFFAKVLDDSGQEFLRAYEYERNRKVFISIDFHLPEGAKELGTYVRIINQNDLPTPMYWWTNIAIKEDRDVRIFSDTNEVLYIKPESIEIENSVHQFGRGTIDNLPSLPGRDASEPRNFPFASEYFFQTPQETVSPWEAAVYNDGFTFFEKSTSLLQYRKMFCWGTHSGGRNWCDYLSEPGKGDYLEIQAGISPTQVHGLEMPGNSTWDFTQIFGSTTLDVNKSYLDWDRSKNYVQESLTNILDDNEVLNRHETYKKYAEYEPVQIIHNGSGWGALEEQRDGTPKGLVFPESTIGPLQKPWVDLLETGIFPSDYVENSWMVDAKWKELLLKHLDKNNKNPWPLIHLGVILYEEGDHVKALELWEKSLRLKETPIALRNVSIFYKDKGQDDKALEYMFKSVNSESENRDIYLTVELMELLYKLNRYKEVWETYNKLPPDLKQNERIIVLVGLCAFEIEEYEFLEELFNKEFAYIKEGETRLFELWDKYCIKKYGSKKTAPKTIDFSMA